MEPGSTTPGEAVLSLRGVTKRFGKILAVDHVSFDVARGEVLGFLGPNAAGKTTTMRILACFIAPDEGSASVAGFGVIEKPIEVRRRIGYLPESAPLYPDLEVLDHIRYVARLRGLAGRDLGRSIGRVMEACGLSSVARRTVGTLSKGYRQRVGLAITMVHDPEVLFLDEPTTGLDPSQIIEIRTLIREVGREKTVVLSTHILPEVEAVCSKVLIIDSGRIVAEGRPRDLARAAAGRATVRMLLLAPEAQALAALAALPHVADAQPVGRATDGYVEYLIAGDDADAMADAIFDLARGQGWRLRELAGKAASLEDIFLRLTSGSGLA